MTTPAPHDSDVQFITAADGTRLAYRRSAGREPGIVFFGGFRSHMEGEKAQSVHAHAQHRQHACLRFDYSGHGRSGGRFEDGTIGGWADEAVLVIDALTTGPQILVGSSLGGWIALLAALARPERIAGILTVALAADFTVHLHEVLFDETQRETLVRARRVTVPDCYGDEPYVITRRLIEEAAPHLLLDKPRIPISTPVRLIHGKQDADVPWQTSERVRALLDSNDVHLTFIEDGDHRLSRPSDIELILRQLDDLIHAARPRTSPSRIHG